MAVIGFSYGFMSQLTIFVLLGQSQHFLGTQPVLCMVMYMRLAWVHKIMAMLGRFQTLGRLVL